MSTGIISFYIELENIIPYYLQILLFYSLEANVLLMSTGIISFYIELENIIPYYLQILLFYSLEANVLLMSTGIMFLHRTGEYCPIIIFKYSSLTSSLVVALISRRMEPDFNGFNPCSAEPGYTLPLQTVLIKISWLLKKLTDLDLHCLSIRM